MAQKHKIRSLEVILDTPWESSPQAVRDRIKKLFLQKLTDRLDIIFSEFYGPETHLQIDQVSIDLGDLNEENLEEEVEERVETELRKILVAIKGNEGRAKNIKADLKSEINALEFYLQNGGWPWWWQPENATTLSQLIAKQLRHAPADSFAMLLRFRNQALPLRRLLLNSSENQKLALFQLFQPPKSAISAIASVLKLNLPIAKT